MTRIEFGELSSFTIERHSGGWRLGIEHRDEDEGWERPDGAWLNNLSAGDVHRVMTGLAVALTGKTA